MKTIKITKEDKFVWLRVTEYQATFIFKYQLFDLYELHDNDAESLISTQEELEKAIEFGSTIGIEVGKYNIKN